MHDSVHTSLTICSPVYMNKNTHSWCQVCKRKSLADIPTRSKSITFAHRTIRMLRFVGHRLDRETRTIVQVWVCVCVKMLMRLLTFPPLSIIEARFVWLWVNDGGRTDGHANANHFCSMVRWSSRNARCAGTWSYTKRLLIVYTSRQMHASIKRNKNHSSYTLSTFWRTLLRWKKVTTQLFSYILFILFDRNRLRRLSVHVGHWQIFSIC